MTQTEFLSSLVYRDSEAQSNASVGTFQELFKDFEALPIKHSKTGAAHSTIMLRNVTTNRVTNVICSLALTNLFRANLITMNEIVGFPIFQGTNGGVFVGLPAQGWTAIATITKKDYVVAPITVNNLLNASA